MDVLVELKRLREIQAARVAKASENEASKRDVKREQKLLADIDASISNFERQTDARGPKGEKRPPT